MKTTIITMTTAFLLACGQAFAAYSPELQAKAEQGDAAAQYELGECYMYALGVKLDRQEAVKWCRKAAEQGYAPAQDRLGHWYGLGEGVEMDEVESYKWYRKAAEQGYAPAQYELGKCYWCGAGVEKDLIQAARWLCKALEQDDDIESWYIPDEIKEELRQAAEKGDAEAQAELRKLESRE